MSRELDARVAEMMGYRFWLEQRGNYRLAVKQRPGDREPWTRYRDRTAEHYQECSAAVAATTGFFGEGMPAFSSDPTACEMVKKECRLRGWWYEESWDDATRTFGAVVADVLNYRDSGDSQHEAFCLAFLAAVEAEQAHASAK
jgi:hypothetical protein